MSEEGVAKVWIWSLAIINLPCLEPFVKGLTDHVVRTRGEQKTQVPGPGLGTSRELVGLDLEPVGPRPRPKPIPKSRN